jgi:hypothetical protein
MHQNATISSRWLPSPVCNIFIRFPVRDGHRASYHSFLATSPHLVYDDKGQLTL